MLRRLSWIVLVACLLATLPARAGATYQVRFLTAGQSSSSPSLLGTSYAVPRVGVQASVWVEMSAGSDTFELACWHPDRAAWISMAAFNGDTSYYNDSLTNRYTVGSDCAALAIFRQTSTGTVTTSTDGTPKAFIEIDIKR